MEGPSPGWYPDPWASGYHRYWDGTTWTGDAFPHAPVSPADAPVTPPGLPHVMPPPPEWAAAPTAQLAPPAPTRVLPALAPAPAPEPEKPAGLSTAVFVALVVVMMLIVGSLATIGAYYAFGGRSKSTPVASPPTTPAPGTLPFPPGLIPLTPGTGAPASPAAPADPSSSVLSGLVVTQADVVAPTAVATDPDGRGVAAAPTLDLCNGTYPSESARTARLQVTAYDDAGSRFLSTEAVLYSAPADTAQGFSELKAAAEACPASTAQFKAAPDGAWPAVTTVERLAFDFVQTDATPTPHHVIAVYLRRGRVLMGVYFDAPDGAQPSVAGQKTVAGIAGVFATRMAALASSVTG